MPDLVTGTCNCGQHSFTIPKPTEMNLCHCTDCKKWAGAMHSAHLFVRTTDIQSPPSAPAPRTWRNAGDSGVGMERAWCDGCGAGLWLRSGGEGREGMTFLKAGLFEKGDIPNPTMENWMRNMEPWETPAKGTKRTSDVN